MADVKMKSQSLTTRKKTKKTDLTKNKHGVQYCAVNALGDTFPVKTDVLNKQMNLAWAFTTNLNQHT